jgi:hypothetical protein
VHFPRELSCLSSSCSTLWNRCPYFPCWCLTLPVLLSHPFYLPTSLYSVPRPQDLGPSLATSLRYERETGGSPRRLIRPRPSHLQVCRRLASCRGHQEIVELLSECGADSVEKHLVSGDGIVSVMSACAGIEPQPPRSPPPSLSRNDNFDHFYFVCQCA